MQITIIGIGGTGCRVAELLSKSDHKLTLIDRDIVEESNLHRQTLYTKQDVGKGKVVAAGEKLKCETKFEDINPFSIDLEGDLVIDCTDNTQTRLLINDYCKKNRIPWIYTGAIADLGVIYFNHPEGACFNCFNQERYGDTCNDADVLDETLSKVASLTASMALDYLDHGKSDNRLIRFKAGTTMKLKINRNPNCSACNGSYRYLNSRKNITRFCSGTYQIRLNRKIDLDEVERRMGKEVERNSYFLRSRDFTIFSHGTALIKASTEAEAKKKYDEMIGITPSL